MGCVGSVIHSQRGNFKVHKERMRVPEAWQEHGKTLIRHKFLDYLYTDNQVREDYGAVFREISSIMSRLMGGNSIIPLGALQKENGVYCIEGTFKRETTRFCLFTEEQAKDMKDAWGKPIDLNAPAFAAIEDGYEIADGN